MARDVSDEIYYMSSGGKIPVKWTAPEVGALSELFDMYLLLQITIIKYYV